MESQISNVCFVGIYGHNQDDVLRRGLDDRNVSLSEVAVPKASVSEAISERRLPMYTMRATIHWLGRFPSWTFPVLFVGTFVVHILATWFVMASRIGDLREADVLVVPHMGDTSVFAVKPIAVLLDTPLVYFSHNGLYYPLIENQRRFERDTAAARMLFYADKVIHRLADRVVVFSEESKWRFVETYGTSEDDYEVLYITAIESNFDKEIEPDESLKCDVLYWGNFHPHHGPITMVEAAASMPERDFVFLGESQKRTRVVETVDRIGAENVAFPGFVPSEDLVRYIKSADVVLGPVGDNPQTEFTIGTKVAEAAYLEKAIVLGCQPATTETFTHREDCMLVEPGNADAVADAIREVLSDEELQNRLERGAFEAYRTYFSTDRTTSRFLDIAEDACAEVA